MKSAKKTLQKAGSSLYKLNPKMNEGVLVVGRRLENAQINDEAKHPMILPYKHHVTNLIIKHHHVAVGHMSQESVIGGLAVKFVNMLMKDVTLQGRVIHTSSITHLIVTQWELFILLHVKNVLRFMLGAR